MDNKISREEFLKYYIDNEINPKFVFFKRKSQLGNLFSKNLKKIFQKLEKD